ncbi:MarR family winged helix-turn-helix transcriptional regulator [Conexibacter sp. CPCC 206217]|uniref:MarR family winged helix-turn-helix transcriptional regulator n=1 Tax=Conexibacter sp. CPCC 206217 TaxID=3064574 RepID=UPI00271E6808|nr:MarR family winged helix-turn-helix transcriptional regulator [Conexibacter sp. CPCC 206217]MDO8214180.1 MarR family winged helix-turn-helix transcriptional regulator [Conexibacter sp. CPCC 206217]
MSEPLNTNLCWLLSRASYTLTTELTAQLQQLDLSPRTHQVLVAADTGEHTQSDLVKAVGMDKTTMVVTVDDLEAAGLAERIPSKTDRRARVIAVTRAGRRKLRAADRIIHAIHDDVLDVLPKPQRAVFMESLITLVGSRLADAVPTEQPVRRRAPRVSA